MSFIVDCFGGRSFRKACTCATDAMRFAITNIVGAKKAVCGVAVYSYVGGDKDLEAFSSISSANQVSQADDLPLVPLPYTATQDRNLKLEFTCLQHIVRLSMRYKLEGTPMRGLVFELVLAYSGLRLHPDFVAELLPVLARLQIEPIVDETMTGARCAGACPHRLKQHTNPQSDDALFCLHAPQDLAMAHFYSSTSGIL